MVNQKTELEEKLDSIYFENFADIETSNAISPDMDEVYFDTMDRNRISTIFHAEIEETLMGTKKHTIETTGEQRENHKEWIVHFVNFDEVLNKIDFNKQTGVSNRRALKEYGPEFKFYTEK